MRTIHKFEIVGNGRFQLPLPEQYNTLHVEVQGNTPYIWIELDTDHPVHWDTFVVMGTGWDLDNVLSKDEHSWHIGTWLQGPWVWHLYQIISKDWFYGETSSDEEDGEQQIP